MTTFKCLHQWNMISVWWRWEITMKDDEIMILKLYNSSWCNGNFCIIPFQSLNYSWNRVHRCVGCHNEDTRRLCEIFKDRCFLRTHSSMKPQLPVPITITIFNPLWIVFMTFSWETFSRFLHPFIEVKIPTTTATHHWQRNIIL